MKQFLSVNDVPYVQELVELAIACKRSPQEKIGNGLTMGLIFFNPSLRTRMSTQKAAQNLGMEVIVLNISDDGWQIEIDEGTVMDGGAQEHIKDAARVMGGYCDILGVRTFAGLKDRESDYDERILNAFVKYAGIPIVSLESATLHPLQSLTDLMTIKETGIIKPKVVVTWANHPRTLPQAVTNSFLQWIKTTDAEVILTHPEGYELMEEFTNGIEINHNQNDALEGADFVYTKNWSSYNSYGQTPKVSENWMITEDKMARTNDGRFMHCLPIRRNVIATDAVIDKSIVYRQAENRVWSAQAVLASIINKMKDA